MVVRAIKEVVGGSLGFTMGAIGGGALGNLLDKPIFHSGINLPVSPVDLPLLHHAEVTGPGIYFALLGALLGTAAGLKIANITKRENLEPTDYSRPGF